MDKRFLSILAALVVLFVGIFVVSQHSGKNSSNSNGKGQATSHITGEGKKNVTLVEYGDYQCPVCYSYYLPLKQVAAQFSKDIHFQFRNLPLVQVHKNAFAGARAAEAAGLQNKYWQMHDQLYDNQDPSGQSGWVASSAPLSFFTTFAQQIGLNVNQFKQDYSSDKVNNAINADLAAFNKTGQQMGTPSFFLDGKYISNKQLADSAGPSVAKFTSLINAEIAKRNP